MPSFAVFVNLDRVLLAIGLLALGGCYGGGVQTGAPLFAAGTKPAPGPTQPAPTQPAEPAPTPTPAPEPPPTPPPVTQCSDGLAAVDLAGQCRASPPTMGALEAVSDVAVSAARAVGTSNSSLGSAQPADGGNVAAYLIRLWSK